MQANTDNARIPAHILTLVKELDEYVKSVVNSTDDDVAERESMREGEIAEALRVLGWGWVLNDETGHWEAFPLGYTIVHNFPDPLYYPQRLYQFADQPPRFEYLWKEKEKWGFPKWQEAAGFVFDYEAEQQTALSLAFYGVRQQEQRETTTYCARSADQAVHRHLNALIERGSITLGEVLQQRFAVWKHCEDRYGYCEACHSVSCPYEQKTPSDA